MIRGSDTSGERSSRRPVRQCASPGRHGRPANAGGRSRWLATASTTSVTTYGRGLRERVRHLVDGEVHDQQERADDERRRPRRRRACGNRSTTTTTRRRRSCRTGTAPGGWPVDSSLSASGEAEQERPAEHAGRAPVAEDRGGEADVARGSRSVPAGSTTRRRSTGTPPPSPAKPPLIEQARVAQADDAHAQALGGGRRLARRPQSQTEPCPPQHVRRDGDEARTQITLAHDTFSMRPAHDAADVADDEPVRAARASRGRRATASRTRSPPARNGTSKRRDRRLLLAATG